MGIVLGIVLMLHGALIAFATICAVIGYIGRDLWKDAIGAALTIGISAVCEIIFGCSLIF